jgi:hypothetical protein
MPRNPLVRPPRSGLEGSPGPVLVLRHNSVAFCHAGQESSDKVRVSKAVESKGFLYQWRSPDPVILR